MDATAKGVLLVNNRGPAAGGDEAPEAAERSIGYDGDNGNSEGCQANLCHSCTLNGTVPGGNCCDATWRCVYDSVFQYNVCKPPKEWLCVREV